MTINSTESGTVDAARAPLSRAVLLDAPVVPSVAATRVEVRRITMAPGFAAGFHVHNCPVFGSILEGSVIYQLEGAAASVLRPGDVFHEPAGVPVRFDAGEEGASFLGYFLLGQGQEPAIEPAPR